MSVVGAPPAAADRRTPIVRAIVALGQLELRLLLRSAESLLVTLGIPLGVLVFFSLIDDVLPTGGADAVDFLVPGVLTISAMSAGLVSLAIATAFERKYGVLKLLGGSPLPRWGLLAGKGLAVLTLLAGQTALVLLVASFGLGWSASAAGVVYAALGLVVGAATFSALGLLLAGVLRAEGTLAVSNALFLVLLVVSGLAFEADALPGPLAAVGLALPSGALGEVLRGALGTAPHVPGAPIAIVAAWGSGAAVLASRTFRWEP